MVKRIVAILSIFVCASVAWAILGATIFSRTYSSDGALESRVASVWGAPHDQTPPSATSVRLLPKTTEAFVNGEKQTLTEHQPVVEQLALDASDIDVALDLEHRRKGLLWYSTYKVAFSGAYSFRNATAQKDVIFHLKFPTERANYDDLVFTVDGRPAQLTHERGEARAVAEVRPGETAVLRVSYRSQGLGEWRYSLGAGDVAQARNFRMRMNTNFKAIDFPDNTLAPAEKRETANGWELLWESKNLVSGFQIAMVMPEKLQPGPLAGRISLFAPVSLFFFFFLMFIITTMRGIELHPMNYFFLAAAFFSFHLLLAYLVDHISIHAAFAASSVVSIFLVVSYLRLVTGMNFATREAGLAQFVYLVMFSYAFFFKGFTGLAITIGSILTLFAVMQITGRVRWAEKFAGGALTDGKGGDTSGGTFAGKAAPTVTA